MFVSIKWKLSLALISVGAILVLIYILIAKSTFESDKISYVFDNESSKVEMAMREFNQRIEQSVFYTNALIASYDFSSHQLRPTGQSLFDSQAFIQSIELVNKSDGKVILEIHKDKTSILDDLKFHDDSLQGPMNVVLLDASTALMIIEQTVDQKPMQIRTILKSPGLIPKRAGFYALQGKKIISERSDIADEDSLLSLVTEGKSGTFFRKIGSKDVLISMDKAKVTDVWFISVTPKSEILHAMQVLYRRSLAFFFLSMSLTVAIALLLSKNITQNLAHLAVAARDIGLGKFSYRQEIRSNDEVGILSQAFQVMGREIERLLIETKDKVRMEEELKTASLVQESLFPARSHYKSGQMEICGLYATSTECGGDWWYYFERDDALYVAIADATGHGTPAALITSAARSIFSKLEESKMTLAEMMTAWDHAIASCSNGRVFMTAQLYKIEKTGRVAFINASHEPPLRLIAGDEKLEGEYLNTPMNSTLGERRKQSWTEEMFQFEPGQALVLLTDGLFALEDASKKTLGDRRFARSVCKETSQPLSAPGLIQTIQTLIARHRGDMPYPDDVTIVAIVRES